MHSSYGLSVCIQRILQKGYNCITNLSANVSHLCLYKHVTHEGTKHNTWKHYLHDSDAGDEIERRKEVSMMQLNVCCCCSAIFTALGRISDRETAVCMFVRQEKRGREKRSWRRNTQQMLLSVSSVCFKQRWKRSRREACLSFPLQTDVGSGMKMKMHQAKYERRTQSPRRWRHEKHLSPIQEPRSTNDSTR